MGGVEGNEENGKEPHIRRGIEWKERFNERKGRIEELWKD